MTNESHIKKILEGSYTKNDIKRISETLRKNNLDSIVVKTSRDLRRYYPLKMHFYKVAALACKMFEVSYLSINKIKNKRKKAELALLLSDISKLMINQYIIHSGRNHRMFMSDIDEAILIFCKQKDYNNKHYLRLFSPDEKKPSRNEIEKTLIEKEKLIINYKMNNEELSEILTNTSMQLVEF